MDTSEKLKVLMEMVPRIQAALGPLYEVVLHDFADLEHSIVAISGNVTGRCVGGSITNVVLSALKAGDFEDMVGYRATLPDGRLLRSSTVFIKDDAGRPVGCLCINLDLTPFVAGEKALRTLTSVTQVSDLVDNEDFPCDVAQLVQLMIKRTLDRIPKPVALMTKEDKAYVIRQLDETGLFLIRGAVEAVGNVLCLSRASVYGYLSEIRGERLVNSGSIEGQ